MSSLRDSIIYCLIKGFAFVVQRLPNRFALALGRLTGRVCYHRLHKKRAVVYSNLKTAFGASKSPSELRRISCKLFENFGENFVDLLRLSVISRSGFDHYVQLMCRGHVVESLKNGKGVVILAIHSGSWELASIVGSMLGFPYKIVVNAQRKATRLEKLLNSYRRAGGGDIITTGFGARDIIKSLRNNEILSLVVDQGGKEGILINFLGRTASMSTGAMRLGLKYDVPICPVFIYRDRNGHHRLVVSQPLTLSKTGDEEADIKINLSAALRQFEQWVCEFPSEYMWFYKVWKYSDQRSALILDDGRTGHLRQSQAIAQKINELLQQKNKKLDIETVQVRFRSRMNARIYTLFTFLIQYIPWLRTIDHLQWFLNEDSYKALTSLKADYVISCGSAMAGVNYMLAKEQSAKNIVVLKPGILKPENFDLNIMPQHDNPVVNNPKVRMAVTKIAPNLIDKKYLEEQEALLLARYSHLKSSFRVKIGVLIGGNAKEIVLSEQQVKIVINQIKEAANQINADLLVTTSRRTSPEIEGLLQRELKKFERCALLIIANRVEVPEAVGGILALSDIVVVSGESISMISEAVSSGKKIVVFSLSRRDARAGKNKYNRFVDQLNEQGYLISSDAHDIARNINNLVKNKIHTRPVSDREILLNAIEQIL